uniref:isopentenyl-diphosphate Delta-isomerase n=1 Tax=Aplanochytrium stocchinoi TaxID=215587 RepID=A0A7S3PGL3_9STRA|mmetsp:Transcript_375/g.433  ORF Transcript_375/g.433 Transcript_375/m.433 type:complete len:536 (-) Transcript_375:1112-2719(-)|eukprot:CAMPEP_0204823014 /NCGR_PEP_ID=MMETSP1346-20131115/1186_1 /ASSEMBLY_ACC=CAM_ASM_000771 /TAXON_ID=215587 /ORGANISM="Aplanochytrium stocchinoi, Strain GSBS06" /LENGTH=535 /DNA_ID=CAMNT_0051949537 /DNA_START=288 /DNA_END=1898 /DNA_ORIENTATION=+
MDISTEGDVSWKTCVVVDEDDNVLRIGGLAECHTVPMTLHRAFSVFIFDKDGKLLLQQRAKTKYTFPLSWTNSICSHPRNLKKPLEEWVDIRLQDEFKGWKLDNVAHRLKPVGKLVYEARSDHKYGEKEIDTLYFLEVTEEEKRLIKTNPDEIEAVQWVSDNELNALFESDRTLITPWFRAIYNVLRPLYPTMKKFPAVAPNDDLPVHRVGDVSYAKANPDFDHLLQLPFSYLCSNSGKAIRTMLCQAYAEIDKSISPADTKTIAALVEKIHAASLLHDDIEDKSTSRRGAPCAHLIYGVARTINTGAYNYLDGALSLDKSMAHFDELTRYKMITSTLSMLCTLHRAQGADISWGENGNCPTREDYLEMIDGKTCALFQHCATLSGFCGSQDVAAKIAPQFGEFGRFFQIRDDFANLCDPVYWESKGFYEDGDEGKYGYPIILFFEAELVAADKKTWLREKLAKEEGMSLEEKLETYQMLYEAGVLQETRDLCLELQEKLKDNLCTASPTIEKIMLKLSVADVKSIEDVKSVLGI